MTIASDSTAAPHALAKVLETAQFVALTSQAGKHSMHQEYVIDSSYPGITPWKTAQRSPTIGSYSTEFDGSRFIAHLESVLRITAAKVAPSFIQLSDDDIARFDRALFASTEFLYELRL